MKKQLAFCAAVLALGLGAGTTAQAQYGPAYPRVYQPGVPPHQVIAVVRSAGMTPLSRPIRRGPNYVVIASDASGAQIRVVVDGYNGMIVRVRPVAAMRMYRRPYAPVLADPYAPRPRVAIVPPEVGPAARIDDGVIPLPPRSIPNARVAAAPYNAAPPVAAPRTVVPHALAAPASQAPLPRPRPSVASNEVTGATPVPAAPSAPPTVKPVGEGSWPVPAKPEASETKSGELKMVPVAPLD